MIIACYPRIAFSQAKINGGNNVSVYEPVHSWENYYVYGPSAYYRYSMDDFNDGANYKIKLIADDPQIAQNIEMRFDWSGGNYPIVSGDNFEYHEGGGFSFRFTMPSSTSTGQQQLLRFQIFKGLDWQTSFFYYLNTTCLSDWSFSTGTLSGLDYEVSNNLTVATTAYPNGGTTELDGGQSVTLNPGFSTNMSGGGQVLAIIDGCGGAYRMASTSETTLSKEPGMRAALGKEIEVYPNPVTDKFKINFPAEMVGKELNVEVMDINGRILYSHKETTKANTEVDLSAFQTGMYFINISGEGVNCNQKLIKQ